MSETVIVTEAEFAKAESTFRQAGPRAFVPAPASEEALASAILKSRARAAIVGIERYTGALYEALKSNGNGHGAVIVRFGVGHDSVDKSLARQNGILVCNTPGALDISVAEHTLWLMGSLARHVPRLEAAMRSGQFTGQTGGELRGRSLGILGFGQIGRKVAEMAHFGFGMKVGAAGNASDEELAVREQRSLDEILGTHGLEYYTNDIGRLLRECEYVSAHLPATSATRHFVNAERLAMMKPTAYFINTARGSIVDETALYDALAAKKLAGAALDVFEREPYQPAAEGKDLRKLANVVLTPHIGSNTREANERMAQACLRNIQYFFAGKLDLLTQVRVS